MESSRSAGREARNGDVGKTLGMFQKCEEGEVLGQS